MVPLMEYGENVGILRNLFRDIDLAIIFAKQIMGYSENEYQTIGHNAWYCRAKKEFIKIEGTENLLN